MFNTTDPLHQNLIACLWTICYVKMVVGGCDVLLNRRYLSSRLSRKLIHIAAGSWILFWPLFNEEHPSWRLNVTVPAIYSVQLFVKGALIQDPNDPDVQSMSRTGKPIELCKGPLLFTLLMTYCGLYLYMQETGILIMACLGFGDGMAPIFGGGIYVPALIFYPTYPFGNHDKKTASGSIAFFVASMIGIYIFHSALLGEAPLDWSGSMQVAFVAMLVEATTGAYDNPFIAGSVYFTHQYLQMK